MQTRLLQRSGKKYGAREVVNKKRAILVYYLVSPLKTRGATVVGYGIQHINLLEERFYLNVN